MHVYTVNRISLAHLEAQGIALTIEEAIAVVQTLLTTGLGGSEPYRPVGPPSPGTVLIGEDGSVVLAGGPVAPAVLEIGALLHQLLPLGKHGVSGALRYTIARALHEVIAPPFESIAELSRALARFETGDRADVVRALFTRALPPPRRGIFGSIALPIGATLLAGATLIAAGELLREDQPRPPHTASTSR